MTRHNCVAWCVSQVGRVGGQAAGRAALPQHHPQLRRGLPGLLLRPGQPCSPRRAAILERDTQTMPVHPEWVVVCVMEITCVPSRSCLLIA